MAPAQPSSSRPAPAGASRTAILEALRGADGPLTVQELADDLGLHANTVRFHLTRLAKDGRVREGRADHSGPGRPKLAYEPVTAETAEETAGGDAGTAEAAGGHNGYRLLAQILAGHLAATSANPSQDAVAAGVEWGRHLTDRPAPFTSISAEQAFDKVTTVMDKLGFDIEPGEKLTVLRVHNCPFRSVAADRPDVACSVHLGLIRGALKEMGAPLHAVDLEVSHTADQPCLALFEPAGTVATGEGPEPPESPEPHIGDPQTVTPPDSEQD